MGSALHQWGAQLRGAARLLQGPPSPRIFNGSPLPSGQVAHSGPHKGSYSPVWKSPAHSQRQGSSLPSTHQDPGVQFPLPEGLPSLCPPRLPASCHPCLCPAVLPS